LLDHHFRVSSPFAHQMLLRDRYGPTGNAIPAHRLRQKPLQQHIVPLPMPIPTPVNVVGVASATSSEQPQGPNHLNVNNNNELKASTSPTERVTLPSSWSKCASFESCTFESPWSPPSSSPPPRTCSTPTNSDEDVATVTTTENDESGKSGHNDQQMDLQLRSSQPLPGPSSPLDARDGKACRSSCISTTQLLLRSSPPPPLLAPYHHTKDDHQHDESLKQPKRCRTRSVTKRSSSTSSWSSTKNKRRKRSKSKVANTAVHERIAALYEHLLKHEILPSQLESPLPRRAEESWHAIEDINIALSGV
jgi:hypothetical protein